MLKLERTVQYSNGEENAEERRKYNREPLPAETFSNKMHLFCHREDANTTIDKLAALS